MRKTTASAVGLILLSGLLHAAPAGMDLRPWVGKHRDEVIATWGEPDGVKEKRGGGEVLLYRIPGALRIAYEHHAVVPDLGLGYVDADGNVHYGPAVPAVAGPSPDTYKTLSSGVRSRRIRFHVDSRGFVTRSKPRVFKWRAADREKDPTGTGEE